MKVLYERVAGIDVHKEMVKVAIRSPGEKPWTRKTEVLEFRTFYGVLQAMGRELRRRGVTHVVMEASGIYTDPVYYALAEQGWTGSPSSMTRWTAWMGGSPARPRAGSGRRACSPPCRASATWWRRPGWARSAPPRTCISPRTRSWPPGSRCARGTTSAPASASTAGPGTPAPTSSRCWSRPPGPRSGSAAGCRPGTTGWSAGSAGPRTRRAKKKAITAIAHTLLKIAYQVLKSGVPYQEPGADFYTRRESPQQKQAWLERQLQKLHPDCTVTITITPPEAALLPGA